VKRRARREPPWLVALLAAAAIVGLVMAVAGVGPWGSGP
jgi:hypothetical protein